MDQSRADPREQILERVFPDLRYGGDPDVERYFEYRLGGRTLDALSIYNSRLKPRYPDDAKRVVLLKLYRMRSPAYQQYLKDLLMERADDIIARIRRNIDAMVSPLQGIRLKDTYAVLKAVESVARLLPDDTDAALAYADAYDGYAKLLSYRVREVSRASYLLSEFYKQTLVEDDDAPDFIASSLRAEEERRQSERESQERNFFDLSRIEFDAADVARIEIPAGLEKDEDRTLAYCHKYWARAEDPAFERIVWLYSRKYGTRHYEVFRAIKTGRRRRYADDEILSRVATTIADRYSYTVQGDLYMQAAWRKIKASLYLGTSQRMGSRASDPVAPREVESERQLADAGQAESQPSPALDSAAVPKAGTLTRAEQRPALVAARTRPRAPTPADFRASGSISDRIKSLSGRAYDVYRDIFLAKVRPHIRATLTARQVRPGTVFGEDLNRAEDAVFEFMERNYANSYMDWPGSSHRARVLDLGFDMADLGDIIDSCYRKISA